MTQLEINRVKKVFKDEYFDLGIYRWMNRNKKILKSSFLISFIAVLSIAIMGQSWPLAIWAFAFIGTIMAGGIDHFIIGLRLRKMLIILKEEEIDISQSLLLDLCSDITPN